MQRFSLTEKTLVRDAQKFLDFEPIVVKEADSLNTIAKSIIMNPKVFNVYVSDKEDRLIGLIPIKLIYENIFSQIMQDELCSLGGYCDSSFIEGQVVIAKDIMAAPVYAKIEDTIKDVFKKMQDHNLEELPIVTDRLQIKGCITTQHLLNIWLLSHFSARTQHSGGTDEK